MSDMSSVNQTSHINITLPDGTVKMYEAGTTGYDIASSIAKSLAKASIAVEVNEEQWDLHRAIDQDVDLKIITKDSEEALEIIRHDTAHIMAQAVQELYPGTQVTIGPSIENGFYYDFARDEPFTPEDFDKIEKKMHDIIDANLAFEREVWTRKDAIEFFKEKGELYKMELIQDLPEDEVITLYRQGEWIDLCRGPHMPSTKYIGHAFKLLNVAGAYWRGDHNNAMLQRIYGTAWRNDKELQAHLHMLEEAEKRDHRKIGKIMDLYHWQIESVGNVFWHQNGWTIYRAIESYMSEVIDGEGYQEVRTPQVIDRSLWEASGHWGKFGNNMFLVQGDEDKVMALKPMNCPAHIQIFKQGIKSYRDLPLKMAEYGCCHRNEPSGAMHGLMRVRGFTQDDGHIFCRKDQIASETVQFTNLLKRIYKDFGYEEIEIKFSDRPETRAGSDEVWDLAENSLKEAIEKTGVSYSMNPGEGAFYGPKLEFVLKDAIGRDWQCGTLQLDFVMPERLDATYIEEDGSKQHPVMLHRAVLGSFERFIGVLIENYAGKLPLWLAPIQIVVTTITNDADENAILFQDALVKAGLRVELDSRNEKINYKVREHSLKKTPIIAVIGKREAQEGTVAIRRLGSKEQTVISQADAIELFKKEAKPPAGQYIPLKIK